MSFTIETSHLSKTYKVSFGKRKVQALDDLSLSVSPGTIFGLLGPNGAGKTTLIKILLGVTYPTSGSAMLLGSDIKDYTARKNAGYLPENHRFPLYMSGEEVLRYFGLFSGVEKEIIEKRIDPLLKMVKLSQWRKNKIKTYSKGMMQRLGLAQALINDPELIFLDEPTDGVDPIGRIEIREILAHLKSEGKTVFLNSHLLSETEMVCDRVAILNKGKLIKEGTVKELTEKQEEYLIRTETEIPETVIPALRKNTDLSYSLKVKDIDELNKFIDALRGQGIIIREIIQQKNTLENMFVELINKADRGSAL